MATIEVIHADDRLSIRLDNNLQITHAAWCSRNVFRDADHRGVSASCQSVFEISTTAIPVVAKS
jgi:hypothetical protein